MRYYFYILVILFFIIACRPNSTGAVSDVSLRIKNLPIDSCSIRINHIITGKEVFYQDKLALVDSLIISGLEDDVYIIVVSWPKAYISHQVYNNSDFDKERGDDYFELTKPFYFNKRNGDNYILEVINNVSQEDLERNGTQILKFKNVGCTECDLADEFWDLYTSFHFRKGILLDSLKLEYYASVDSLNLQRSKELFGEMDKVKGAYVNDDVLDNAIIQKISENSTSKISTFFLFYQLYNYRNFSKFQNAFLSLSDKAKDTKYYRMIQRQY